MTHIKIKNSETTECNRPDDSLLTVSPDKEDVIYTYVNLCRKCETKFEKEGGLIIRMSQ